MRSKEGLAYAHEGMLKSMNSKGTTSLPSTILTMAIGYIEQSNSPFFHIDILNIKGRILNSKKEYESAKMQYKIALTMAKTIGYQKYYPVALEQLSQSYFKIGNSDSAYYFADLYWI